MTRGRRVTPKIAHRSRRRQLLSPTTTATGELVKLVVHDGEVLGAVAIRCPLPWVYRKPVLEPADVA